MQRNHRRISYKCLLGLLGAFILSLLLSSYASLIYFHWNIPTNSVVAIKHLEDREILTSTALPFHPTTKKISPQAFQKYTTRLIAKDAKATWQDRTDLFLPHFSTSPLTFAKARTLAHEALDESFSANEIDAVFKRIATTLPIEEQTPLTYDQAIRILSYLDTLNGYYDVLVYGSELESVAAATVAAQGGATVALLHEKPQIGGLLVDGKLNFVDVPESDGTWLMQGFALSFYNDVQNSFSFSHARQWMASHLEKSGVFSFYLPLSTWTLDASHNHIHGLHTKNQKTFYAQRWIDASENGDLMAESQVPFSLGFQRLGRNAYASSTLLYELKNVDFSLVQETLKKRANAGDILSGSTDVAAWGFGAELKAYQPHHASLLVRAINMSYVKESKHLVLNHVMDVNIDPLDPSSVAASRQRQYDEIAHHLLPYLREHVPGFAHAELAEVAKDLYLRDSRHLEGAYILKAKDLVNRTEFPDTVLITNYAIDIHPDRIEPYNKIVYRPQSYNIPYRVLYSPLCDNLYVSSKCASYSPVAAGSTRIVMTGTMMSEVAARASLLGIVEDEDASQLSVPALQKNLKHAGFIDAHPAPLKKVVDETSLERIEKGENNMLTASSLAPQV